MQYLHQTAKITKPHAGLVILTDFRKHSFNNNGITRIYKPYLPIHPVKHPQLAIHLQKK